MCEWVREWRWAMLGWGEGMRVGRGECVGVGGS